MTNCIFEPSIDTAYSTICKWCGEEKILHNHNIQVPQLYTEEQVREAYYQGAADVHDKCIHRTWRGVETKVDIELLKKLNAEYIQSLKQPKK